MDERLFGWSRSANRGTNGWGASEQPSRVTSPSGSDDEDQGDYEYVLGYLPSDGDGTPSRLRSRSVRSSYADLQQLKSTPVHTTGAILREEPVHVPGDESGLHYRSSQHRDRRASLNDDVPVERIGALDPAEPFKEATKDINEENVQRKHEGNAC